MKIKKDYLIEEGVLVTMRVLECLYSTYYCCYPDKIFNEIKILLQMMGSEIDKDHVDIDYDAIDFQLIQRAIYETNE